ncbi:4-hydroxythreonine-4-phosphate dehydrogenase PdxA [Staphylococcus simulans]|uniref:4-hydroxythreonine-4-phosphate dehydrogenase PdxA n=1 Tax=Staphylococcus simulans TaxID=1286 RepID=UPI000D1D43FF|nr:4-hydroxythreonine-4-phosphate dehydrogenase PdxA [Staphylococcus simulans]PTJ21386.1 4-hydroxythreonine-4-phosphate dehydrogenase PdxA [Staphylococcus simulans]
MKSLTGITMGDPLGIGPEVSLKAINNEDYINNIIIFGSSEVIKYYADLLKVEKEINVIDDVSQFKENTINVFDNFDFKFSIDEIGTVQGEAGDAAYQYIEKAIELALNEEIGPIVTAPLNKEALHLGDHKYDGHTEIFAKLTDTKKYTMMLWSENLSVVHVSTHVSLRKACDLVKKERVKECIDLANSALQNLGISKPKIAVAGLNPHSGEAGLFGNEDKDEIEPAVKEKAEEWIDVVGPIAPDTVYLKAYQGHHDIVVSMYHDQGHIPMKLLAFDDGVNVTLGLPIIRTSVDHGTAFDIAGKGIANETSMFAAVDLAKRFAKNI